MRKIKQVLHHYFKQAMAMILTYLSYCITIKKAKIIRANVIKTAFLSVGLQRCEGSQSKTDIIPDLLETI